MTKNNFSKTIIFIQFITSSNLVALNIFLKMRVSSRTKVRVRWNCIENWKVDDATPTKADSFREVQRGDEHVTDRVQHAGQRDHGAVRHPRIVRRGIRGRNVRPERVAMALGHVSDRRPHVRLARMRPREGRPTGDGEGCARAARYHYDIHRRGAGRLRCLNPCRSEVPPDRGPDVGVPGEHPAAVVWCGMVFPGD